MLIFGTNEDVSYFTDSQGYKVTHPDAMVFPVESYAIANVLWL